MRAEITKSEGGGELGTNDISIEGKEVYTVYDQKGGCAGGWGSTISKIKPTSFETGPWRQGMEVMPTRQDLTELSTQVTNVYGSTSDRNGCALMPKECLLSSAFYQHHSISFRGPEPGKGSLAYK